MLARRPEPTVCGSTSVERWAARANATLLESPIVRTVALRSRLTRGLAVSPHASKVRHAQHAIGFCPACGARRRPVEQGHRLALGERSAVRTGVVVSGHGAAYLPATRFPTCHVAAAAGFAEPSVSIDEEFAAQ